MLPLTLMFVFLAMLPLAYQHRYSCRTGAPCGCSVERVILPKIVGGEPVRTRSWSWLVSLADYSGHNHFCGGSILSSSWVLTAAHCVSDRYASNIIINAGSNKLDQSTQKRRVAKIVSHPYYQSSNYVNDIALIQLSPPLDMTDPAIAKICIPLPTASVLDSSDDIPYVDEYPPVNSTLVAIGWGAQTEESNLPTRKLQQVILKTVAYESSTCRRWITSPEVQFCAGVDQGGKDTCLGDSGGPLMKFTSSRQWIVAGVTSFGRGCARPENSGVYTRVTFYSEWINATMNAEDMITDSFLTAHDTLLADNRLSDIFSKESANICSRYYTSSLLYIVIAINLSLYFMRGDGC